MGRRKSPSDKQSSVSFRSTVSSGPALAGLGAIVLAIVLRAAVMLPKADTGRDTASGPEAAEAEWRRFKSLPKPQSEMATLGEQAIEHLEACERPLRSVALPAVPAYLVLCVDSVLTYTDAFQVSRQIQPTLGVLSSGERLCCRLVDPKTGEP